MRLGLLSSSHDFGRAQWLEGTPFERVEIEIGPGDCGYLKAAAAASPSTLHVGIEIRPSSLAVATRRGTLPPNLRLMVGDASWIVENLLAPGSVDAYHVYFPDPWWKKKHHKRRIFQPRFCEAALSTLVPGGAVLVATDVVPLFAEIRERLVDAGFAEEPWQRNATDTPCSSYERKYRRQGRHFEQAIFRKPAAR